MENLCVKMFLLCVECNAGRAILSGDLFVTLFVSSDSTDCENVESEKSKVDLLTLKKRSNFSFPIKINFTYIKDSKFTHVEIHKVCLVLMWIFSSLFS